MPDDNVNLCKKFSLFTTPFFVWTPENAFKNRMVPCPLCDGCIPKGWLYTCWTRSASVWIEYSRRVKEYSYRPAEEHDITVCLAFMSYTCASTDQNTNTTRFATIGKAFLANIGTALANRFPYILTHKKAIHEDLFHDVHDVMRSPKGKEQMSESYKFEVLLIQPYTGLSPLLTSVKTRRMKRFAALNMMHAHDPQFMLTPVEQRPKAPSASEYLLLHSLTDAETFQQAWLVATGGIEELARVIMELSPAQHAISFDGTYKFLARMKTAEPNTNKMVSLPQMKVLNIVQNEIGQIMDIRCMSSESHETLWPVLEKIEEIQDAAGFSPTADHKIIVVTDNLSNTQAIIEAMGEGYLPKHDPFHVQQRILDKVADKVVKEKLCGKLTKALYIGKDEHPDKEGGDHCNAAEAAVAFQAACDEIETTEISQKALTEWTGTTAAYERRGKHLPREGSLKQLAYGFSTFSSLIETSHVGPTQDDGQTCTTCIS
ncbi:hypothetical protein DFS34DRAFT_686227 [Phlyctochytrium arcticum]|nr:hypothetical protein DFS34DRAFT_686227 [Phlyctochytrium arcticum]